MGDVRLPMPVLDAATRHGLQVDHVAAWRDDDVVWRAITQNVLGFDIDP